MNKIYNNTNWNIGIVGGMSIGKDFYGDGSDYDFEYLENEMFKNIKKGSNIIVIASATNDGENKNKQEEYSEIIRKKLIKHGYNCTLLKSNDFFNKDKVKEILQNTEVIIELGGNTLAMVNYWNVTGFSNLLIKVLHDNTKYIGISAGAIALFDKGLSDAFITEGLSDNYYFVEGIKYFQNTLLVPHYSASKNEKIREMITNEPDKVIICIPNGVSLIIDEQNRLYKFLEQPNRQIVYDNEDPFIIYSLSNNKIEKRIFEINQIGTLDEIIPNISNNKKNNK